MNSHVSLNSQAAAAADDAGSDEESEYKATTSEDSESDDASAAPKGGKKLQSNRNIGKKTSTDKDPPPLQRKPIPRYVHNFCEFPYSPYEFIFSYEFIFFEHHNSPYEFICFEHHMNSHLSLNSQTLKAKELFLAINYNPKLGSKCVE